MMGVLRRSGGIIAGVLVLALIVVGVVLLSSGGGKTKHITAYFTRTVGLYTGNDVRIMGVKVGTIDSITPAGPRVKVVMSYDADDKVPQSVGAVVITPSIVSDRYIQLSPAYRPGQTLLPDNAVLGCPPDQPDAGACSVQTRVPLELDQIFGNLDQLNRALGPKGANRHGALSRLIQVGAANLKGNGGHFNKTLRAFSAAISTLAGSKDDLFATVSHLQSFTSTLAKNDGGVRALNTNLAKVGGQLAGERRDLGAALANLATALSAVNNFVSANKNSLTNDIHGLAKVTNVLTKEKEAITQFTDLAPLALSDLGLTYDPQSMTLDTKSDTAAPISQGGPSGAICQLFQTIGLGNLLPDITGCGSSSKANTPLTHTTNSRNPKSLTDLLGVTGR
jgi:phospholipid/cholesterol/gamma-HCH transport system substrate-binding protein